MNMADYAGSTLPSGAMQWSRLQNAKEICSLLQKMLQMLA